ncbi:hypothetical protein HXX76_010551 [Chlamydomonas incerta]|uniref:Phosphoglycerate kinase n=1 Tax=Chlamydomonas incerta TaxID=51695 RepID=A0A835SR12_CHLIN|nr:hypothetical protein HXX76_010551 [Chlamydomonas incerta]|eukprot:KAG2429767.1 hypothetical protein HXX76_010551 [Chlamydomonas incerta]
MDADDPSRPLRDVVQDLISPERDVANADVSGKRVLLRVDFNVPVDEATGATVTDASRITAVLPTIRLLAGRGARVILASHFGRPEPKKQSRAQMEAAFSLAPVAAWLERELNGSSSSAGGGGGGAHGCSSDDSGSETKQNNAANGSGGAGAGASAGKVFVGLAADCVGPEAEAAVAALQPGQVLLLQNTRFHAGDGANDPGFAGALAALCDVFVQDAFGVLHRDQGSVTGITAHVAECYPGPLVRRELRELAHRLFEPARPLGVVLGGAKVADKIGVVAALVEMADVVAVGGRMAFTLLAARGVSVGSTQIEPDWLEPCRRMMARAAERGTQLLLPGDVLWSSSLAAPVDTGVQVLTLDCCTEESPCIPAGRYGVDIGPATMAAFREALLGCRTIFWNGPMGKFEVPEFGKGTVAVAQAMDEASRGRGAITIIGGGDSVAAVAAAGLDGAITHISTGGGASLELIEGKGMPGLRALLRGRRVPAAPAPAPTPAPAPAPMPLPVPQQAPVAAPACCAAKKCCA